MNRLELKVPPLLVCAIAAAFMGALRWAWPELRLAFPGQLFLAIVLVLIGLQVCLAGVRAFRIARTTVNPMNPEDTSALVTHGVYKITRNPMYLGFLLFLLGWGTWLGHLTAILIVPLFVVYLNRFQIRPEEKMLSQHFGESYRAYCSQVRRWI